MQTLFITASAIASAAGLGKDATLAALRERRGGLRVAGFGGDADGAPVGAVAAADSQELPEALARFDCRNNRLAEAALRTDGFLDAVATARERYGNDRIAVVLGTSTSGVLASEEAYARRDPISGALPAAFDFEHTHDLFSLARYVRARLGLRGPALVVSTACASSAKSFIDAAHLIACGIVDAAVVGGADSLCRMTLRGFAALELISPVPCRPCDAERAGISVGEAAGFALLERDARGSDGAVAVLGYGASSDGHHMSAPHPEGAGAIAAMEQALRRARLPANAVDYVNLHGTGTRANDAMEDVAVHAVFGDAVACSSTKGWTGHTLGAAGIVEAIVAGLCMAEGFVPGSLNVTRVDPAFRARVAVAAEHRPVSYVMSNSFGFGGINCSLLLGRA